MIIINLFESSGFVSLIYLLFIRKTLIFKKTLYRRHFWLNVCDVIYNTVKIWNKSEDIWNNYRTILRYVYTDWRSYGRCKTYKEWHTCTNNSKPEWKPFVNAESIPLYLYIILNSLSEFFNKLFIYVVSTYWCKLIQCFLAHTKYIRPRCSF